MFKIIKSWIYWWKRSRKLKNFLKTEILLASMRPPLGFNKNTRDQVVGDWAKAGYDITVPNFGGGRQETEI